MNVAEASPLYQRMRASSAQWVDIPAPQWDELASIFRVKTVQEQDHVLFPEAKVHELCFVCEGLLRIYCLADNGNESNKAFVAEDMFAGPFAAAFLGLPSRHGMQALEPTTLLTAPYTDYAALLEQHPVFDRFARKYMERLLVQKELRERSFLQQTATERYLDFMQQYPHLVQRVPQYHIASYLGITEGSLSRLRRSLAQEHRS